MSSSISVARWMMSLSVVGVVSSLSSEEPDISILHATWRSLRLVGLAPFFFFPVAGSVLRVTRQ
eukprot:3250451-Ditylum_brightwellii.AAC.1